jgi:hypothetical protein
MKFEINKSYHVADLVEIVRNKSDRDFDKYGKEKYVPENVYDIYIAKNEKLNTNTVLYVGKPVEVDDDDKEIYPNEVLENKTCCKLKINYLCDFLLGA